jgi:hypothetical protein
MKMAYADPPYPGQAKRYKQENPDALEVNHELLIRHLMDDYADGWALSTSSPALRDVLQLCPPSVRDERVDSIVKSLCEQHGYGAVMDSAARLWRAKDPIGAFLVGPCVGTMTSALSKQKEQSS